MLPVVVSVALLLAACAPSTVSPAPSAPPTAGGTPTPLVTATTTPTPAPTPTPTPTAECAARVAATLSPAQRIGQLFLLGLADNQLGPAEIAAIRTHHFGSVWFTEQSRGGVAPVRAVADAAQALADANTTGNIRFFIAANQEGGIIQSLSGPGFSTIPSALDQSRIDPATLRVQAAQWGRELASAGVNFNFAPVLDVVPPGTDEQNEPIGVLRRGYGHDPATVASHALAFMRGMAESGIATSGKHFPGLGRVKGNTDFTADVIDTVTTADDAFIAPFREAVQAGIPTVMVALATYSRIDPGNLAGFSPVVMRDLLRGRLGFGGLIVSDDVGATVAVDDIAPGDRAIRFLAAGGDMIISKTVGPANAMATAVAARAATDAAFRARVDDAALRVIRAKAEFGLVRC